MKDVSVPTLTLPQIGFGTLAQCDVLAGDQHDATAIDSAHRLCRLAHPDDGAIATDLADLPAHDLAEMLKACGERLLYGLPLGFRKHLQHCLANQLVNRVSKLIGSVGIDGEHRPPRIHHEVHGRVVLKDISPLLLALQ